MGVWGPYRIRVSNKGKELPLINRFMEGEGNIGADAQFNTKMATGREDEPHNNTKGKFYFVSINHPYQWVRPLSTAERLAGTGLELDRIRDYGRETNGLFDHPLW